MEIRYTAKGLVSTEDDKLVFVAGQRGMWNLLGGGIDKGETAEQAFLREADEEIEGITAHITDLERVHTVEGPTTSADGRERLAHWTVFRTVLLIPSTELVIANESEITAITFLSPDQCLDEPHMSDLAKRAVSLAYA